MQEKEKCFSGPPPVLVTSPSLHALFSSIFRGNHRATQTAAWVSLMYRMCECFGTLVCVTSVYNLWHFFDAISCFARLCVCVCVCVFVRKSVCVSQHGANKVLWSSAQQRLSQQTCLTPLWSPACCSATLLLLGENTKLQRHQGSWKQWLWECGIIKQVVLNVTFGGKTGCKILEQIICHLQKFHDSHFGVLYLFWLSSKGLFRPKICDETNCNYKLANICSVPGCIGVNPLNKPPGTWQA